MPTVNEEPDDFDGLMAAHFPDGGTLATSKLKGPCAETAESASPPRKVHGAQKSPSPAPVPEISVSARYGAKKEAGRAQALSLIRAPHSAVSF
jgi:hypothetical protein